MAHTGSARAAVEALTSELAAAWADDHVSVIAVAIGRFDTESLRKYPAELWRSAAAGVPLQRLGNVEEYGWLVALLASAARRRALRIGRDDRRRPRQLDRAVAAPRVGPGGEVPTEQRTPLSPPRRGREQVGSGGRGSNPHHRLGRPRLYH